MSTVEIQHSDAATDCNVISIDVQCSEVDKERTEAFLNFCWDGIENGIQRTELLKDDTAWYVGHGSQFGTRQRYVTSFQAVPRRKRKVKTGTPLGMVLLKFNVWKIPQSTLDKQAQNTHTFRA